MKRSLVLATLAASLSLAGSAWAQPIALPPPPSGAMALDSERNDGFSVVQ